MKKIILIMMTLILATSVFAQSFDSAPVKEGLQDFIEDLADTVPVASTMSNVWADGYVGQLLSIPPHFGVGASAGITKMDITGIKKAAKSLGIDATDNLSDNFVFPVASIDAVIGGLFLPFDLSGSFISMNEPFELGKALQFKMNAFNLKVRIPILKQNIILPNLSVGFGFAQSSGEISARLNSEVKTFCTASFKSSIYSADVQLSKSIVFLTPYVGARVLASKSENSWEYSYQVGGIYEDSASGTYANNDLNLAYQVYGGVSFNILVLKLNVNAGYDFKSSNWSAGIGAQIKL